MSHSKCNIIYDRKNTENFTKQNAAIINKYEKKIPRVDDFLKTS